MKLKEYLTYQRKLLGTKFTARHFANELGITEAHLSRIAHEKILPSFRLLRKIVQHSEGLVNLEDFARE